MRRAIRLRQPGSAAWADVIDHSAIVPLVVAALATGAVIGDAGKRSVTARLVEELRPGI
jgi:hypothetical protein